MKPIPLGIDVNVWNVVKFVVLELFMSVVFTSTWILFLRRASARTLRSSAGVRLVPSRLGRLTPAEVGFHAIKRFSVQAEDLELCKHHRHTRVAICAVNLVLFALLFVLEYGSKDLPSIQKRRVNVVTAHSIRAHSQLTALQAGVIKDVPESVKRGFRSESRLALRTRKDAPGAPSEFELIEHIIDDDAKIVQPGVAAAFKDVCGDNEVAKITECTKTLTPFLSENSTEGRMVVAKVTRVHAFFENYRSIYDIALLHSIRKAGDEKIDLSPFRLVGTCSGRSFTEDAILSKDGNKTTVQSSTCVLRETGQSGSGPFVVPNATILFETASRGVLSFMSNIEVETYTAALSMQQHDGAYIDLMRLGSFEFAPFREFRRHVLLLCFALVVFVLVMASIHFGAPKALEIPVDLQTQLLSIRKAIHQANDGDNKWPELKLSHICLDALNAESVIGAFDTGHRTAAI
eukprot:IDg1487t1